MTRAVSIKEVALAAGVSIATVSNVLNRPEAVADLTRQRVSDAMRDLGFVRNESARLLRAGRSRIVGLVVLDVANPFFTDVARGAEQELSTRGLSVMLCDSAESRDKERRYLELLEEQRVHGVLITPTDDAGGQLQSLRERGTAVVLVDRTADNAEACSVSVDDVAGGELVMEHLAAMGHQRVAFVGGPFSLSQVRDRHAGFLRKAAGIDVHVHETTALNVAQGREAAAALLQLPVRARPTAAFCANDLLALGVLQHMTMNQVSVPRELAIVGYDDIDFAAAAAVPLSSVRQPREELGRTAAQLLLDETSQSQHQHRSVVFAPHLVVRSSSQQRRRRR
jgi:LacI family transcriptional regulator